MLDFENVKLTDRFLTRDGHLAFEIEIVHQGTYRYLRGRVTPKAGSVYEKIGVRLRNWELNGRVRPMTTSTKSGFDLISKIT